MFEKIKLALAFAVLLAGVVVYYQAESLFNTELSVFARLGMVAAALVGFVVLVLASDYGKQFLEFAKGSRIELRKMVWPSRQETGQTTMIVLVAVVIVALFLWGIDVLVFKSVYNLLLGVESS